MRAERPLKADRDRWAREEFDRWMGDRLKPAAPRNVRATLQALGDVVRITHRGRLYELGHVSFEDGLRLTEASAAIESIKDATAAATVENLATYLRAGLTVVGMAPRYLRPVTLVGRLLWPFRLRRNPFRNSTDAEVGQLLGFFLASRMRSRVGPATPEGPPDVPTS